MLLWVTLLAGMLIVTTLLVVAMLRAERRARRSLYRALDLSEETVELLMSRNGDVLSELTLVRISPPVATDLDAADRSLAVPAPDTAAHRRHPTIRLVHPAADTPDGPDGDQTRHSSQRHRGV